MGQDWRLEVRGVRGSFPRPDARDPFGGNTSCFFLRCGGTGIVLDAGSGLSALGHDLQNDPNPRRLHILITHFHMDHILGLLSFSPFFDPEREIRIYGPLGVRRTLETLIRPPYWPVTFSDFPATVRFYEVTPGMDYDLGGVRMPALAGLASGWSTPWTASRTAACGPIWERSRRAAGCWCGTPTSRQGRPSRDGAIRRGKRCWR